jgi:UDP-N-acetylglucosamine 2-epimerase (hydrolysing)
LKKKIVFISGTRADFGKIKSVVQSLLEENFKIKIFVTGMHLDKKYGFTFNELKKNFNKKILYKFINYKSNQNQDIVLANTIIGFNKFLKKFKPDLVIVHGDRIEALAGAISATLNNHLTMHIEGGELSGTIDEHLRHSISKLSHLHIVSNLVAKRRLIKKLGENPKSIFACGSPDIDIMKKSSLPNIYDVKKRYSIEFEDYGIVLFHSVTTELKKTKLYTKNLIRSCIKSNKNFIVIYPNNDPGNNDILKLYNSRLKKNRCFKLLKSMRFEYFLTLLKNSSIILGNSSSGIIEAPVYGIPTINLGSRQRNRVKKITSIYNLNFETKNLQKKIISLYGKKFKKRFIFGDGKSSKKITNILKSKNIWNTPVQKIFNDKK